MIKVRCESCQQEFPMADTVKVSDRLLCVACGNAFLAVAKTVSPGAVRREPDPTICARCGADHGETRLEPVAGAPVCPSCANHLRNYPFPVWLKLSAVGLVALVIFSLTWNARFILAYRELHQFTAAMSEGDIDRAAALMTAAADHVPEASDLRLHADYLQGISLLQQDKCDEAVVHFQRCQQLPPDMGVRSLTLQAEMSAAFNKKDYDRFLDRSQEWLRELPQDRTAVAAVASAYACKYAVTGDRQFRNRAMEMLEKAEGMKDQPLEPTYAQRILHRLESREIIDHDEFVKRFPNGWKSQTEGKEQP